jgi:hypothetical protein
MIQSTINYYTKKALIAHARYTAAIDSGEDKIAAKEWASYEDYQAMLKYANNATS